MCLFTAKFYTIPAQSIFHSGTLEKFVQFFQFSPKFHRKRKRANALITKCICVASYMISSSNSICVALWRMWMASVKVKQEPLLFSCRLYDAIRVRRCSRVYRKQINKYLRGIVVEQDIYIYIYRCARTWDSLFNEDALVRLLRWSRCEINANSRPQE